MCPKFGIVNPQFECFEQFGGRFLCSLKSDEFSGQGGEIIIGYMCTRLFLVSRNAIAAVVIADDFVDLELHFCYVMKQLKRALYAP